MGEVSKFKSREIVAKTDGNPEGKGVSGFMTDWYKTEPRGVIAKPQRQVLAEFFTSMLVLSAKFKYEPVIGAPNYLYWIRGEWLLSLIAPHEWNDERRAGFAGTCVLEHDMTWTITPSELLSEDNDVSNAVARFYDGFAHMLDTDLTLEEILPFYVGKLTYYPRLFSSALARSIRGAVILGDQTNIRCSEWQMLLPRLERVMLVRKD